MIKLEQQEDCIKLYKSGRYKIKEIMSMTGIRSEQTIYRILDAAGVPRRPTRETAMKVTISFDKQTFEIIDKVKPKNLSEWICKLIKENNHLLSL